MAVTINGTTGIDKVQDGTIVTADIADSNITTAKIADSNITTAKIAADAVTASKLNVGQLSHRNLIINGAMQVWQRGTSFSGGSTYGYGVDRFMWAQATTNSRSTDVPANEGFTYSTAQQASSGNNILRHVIEDSQRLLGNNTFTLSFWIKGSTSGTGYVDVNDTQEQSYSITTSWQRITKTFTAVTGNANYGSDNDYIDWKTGVTATIYITGVQLEVGSEATPFEHRSYGDELRRCQRYYYQVDNGAQNGKFYAMQYTASYKMFQIPFPTTMRATPTSTLPISSGALTEWNPTKDSVLAYLASATSDTGTYHIPSTGNSAKFDAEL